MCSRLRWTDSREARFASLFFDYFASRIIFVIGIYVHDRDRVGASVRCECRPDLGLVLSHGLADGHLPGMGVDGRHVVGVPSDVESHNDVVSSCHGCPLSRMGGGERRWRPLGRTLWDGLEAQIINLSAIRGANGFGGTTQNETWLLVRRGHAESVDVLHHGSSRFPKPW